MSEKIQKVASVWVDTNTCKVKKSEKNSTNPKTVTSNNDNIVVNGDNSVIVTDSDNVVINGEVSESGVAVVSSKNTKISVDDCEIKVNNSGRLFLNNKKTIYLIK